MLLQPVDALSIRRPQPASRRRSLLSSAFLRLISTSPSLLKASASRSHTHKTSPTRLQLPYNSPALSSWRVSLATPALSPCNVEIQGRVHRNRYREQDLSQVCHLWPEQHRTRRQDDHPAWRHHSRRSAASRRQWTGGGDCCGQVLCSGRELCDPTAVQDV
jgi:hypothetical protein